MKRSKGDIFNGVISLLMGFILIITGIYGFVFTPEQIEDVDNKIECYDGHNNIIVGERCIENIEDKKYDLFLINFMLCFFGLIFLIMGYFQFIYNY